MTLNKIRRGGFVKSLVSTIIFIFLLVAVVVRLSKSMNPKILYGIKITCAILGLFAVVRNFSQTTQLADKVTSNLFPKAENVLNIAADRFFNYLDSTANKANEKAGNILDTAGGK